MISTDFIIPRANHCISKANISPNAIKVLNRLISSGFQAYLVGGSVRDLLLNKAPKDFDVATNATPNEVRNLFRNGRIIGRRFKLVHILFHREIIEVATFRGHDHADTNLQTNDSGMLVRDNIYGSLDEDAWRRDFTVNSLYYNIEDSSIVDYTGGFKDVSNRLMHIIGDAETRYTEDPVRMLRALRFCAKLHFNLEEKTGHAIHQLNHLIKQVSSSRLFDELIKLYHCGEGKAVHKLLSDYGLIEHLLPLTAQLHNQEQQTLLINFSLENTDSRVHEDKPVTPAFIFAILLWFPMLEAAKSLQEQGMHPLESIEKAMTQVIAEQNKTTLIPKRYTQVIREIWLLQYRLQKRNGTRALNLLHHPRFRAAYDFMAIRALAKDEDITLAKWWTTFQEVDEEHQLEMIKDISKPSPAKKPRRRKKAKPQAPE